MKQSLIRFFPFVLIACLCAGLVPFFHGYAHLLAAFRVEISVLLVLFALGFRRTLGVRLVLVSCLVSIAFISSVLPFYLGKGERGNAFVLYQKNTATEKMDVEALVRDIKAVVPDFVTLQETQGPNGQIAQSLLASYPYQEFCKIGPKGYVGVLSKYPFASPKLGCTEVWGMNRAQIQTDKRLISIIGVHYFRPFPWIYSQERQAVSHRQTVPLSDAVVAGDFNSVPWSVFHKNYRRDYEMELLGPGFQSFPYLAKLWGVPIDHVLISKNGKGSVEKRPLFGSDHFGIVARFSFDD